MSKFRVTWAIINRDDKAEYNSTEVEALNEKEAIQKANITDSRARDIQAFKLESLDTSFAEEFKLYETLWESASETNHFEVGDEYEYQGEYEGVYFLGKVTDVKNNVLYADETYELKDGTKQVAKNKHRLTTDAKGNECFVVTNHLGKSGFVYPPAREYKEFDV